MALSRQRAHERRMFQLSEENKDLAKDVSKFEDALALHTRIQCKDHSSVRSLIRKEVGGSIWQHGGEGKLSTYKSSKDLGVKSDQGLGRESVKGRVKSAPVKKKAELRLYPSVEKVGMQKSSISGGSAIGAKGNPRAVSASNITGQKASTRSHATVSRIDQVATGKSGLNVKVPFGETVTLTESNFGKTHTVASPVAGRDLEILCQPVESKQIKHDETRVEVLSKMVSQLRESLQLEEEEERLVETRENQIKPVRKETRTEASASVPRPWDPLVIEWLYSLNLKNVDKYVHIFMDNEIDMESLKLLTEKQLNSMGIVAVGTVAKMLSGIERLKQGGHESLALSDDSCYLATPKVNSSVMTDAPVKIGNPIARPQNEQKTSVATPFGATRVLSTSTVTKPTLSSANRDKLTKKCEVKSGPKSRAQSAVQSSKHSDSNPAKSADATTNKPASLTKDSHRSAKRAAGSSKVTVRSTRTSRIRALPDSCSPTRTAVQDVSPVSTDTEDIVDKVAKTNMPQHNTTELKIDGNALGTERPAVTCEEDSKLGCIESQIKSLCSDLTSPGAIEKINKLQEQLQDIQQQILEKKTQGTTGEIPESGPSLGVDGKEADVKPTSVCLTKTDDKVLNEKATVVSQKMSKTELLKEVRKQKEIHRREIRHLESELSRLKHKDPLRNCEIMEDDVYYLPQDLIGEGAFSQVFRGFYQGSEVAVKQLKVPLSSQDKNYFMAEVNLLKDLRHPRVVLLVGVCTTSRLPLMVLEFMANGSLYGYLHNPQNASLDHAAYYQIARDTALGMNYLHKHRPAVLHLDLKSMNILLTSHLRAKIADFGFSKLKHDANVAAKQSGKSKAPMKGTPAWLAPELLDNRDISTKADVYSFGVILFEMLTRSHPYPECTVFQIIEKIRNNKRPNIPKSCPKPLSSLISRCWDKNPAIRPSFKDIVVALEKLHFPPEWQSLFSKAGVPKVALDDPNTTRSLIQIVTQTLEGKIRRPSDVPALNLAGSDEESNELLLQDIEADEGEPLADQHHGIQGDLNDVEEEFYGQLAMHLKSPLVCGETRRLGDPCAPASESGKATALTDEAAPPKGNFSFLGTTSNCTGSQYENDDNAEFPARSLEKGLPKSVGLSGFDFSPPPMAPPPPPILSFDWGGKNQPPSPVKDEVFEELFPEEVVKASLPEMRTKSAKSQTSHKENEKIVSDLRASQLVKQRKGLRSTLEPHPSEQPSVVKRQAAGPRSSIRASMLNEQRKKLLPTDLPHPNQLTDLSDIGEGQLSNLAEILKRAVDDRRLAMGNTATLDSVETSAWSVDEE